MKSKEQNWDTSLYVDKHAFVYKYGTGLIDVLNPQSGENILDVGCGTGQLTAQIREKGCQVIGIDASEEMNKNLSNLVMSDFG
ncbi:hypothetical protein NBRC110019_09010 [Neptunitalea chrysea]|uniref:Methyltransferase domain-containing protein n=1 Tax=Neptunitalea chrysea TaxID=1647581 RepID=A0A9W6EUX7_9FLAO|nr:class I SAM-dependent methyltransferase [Neptunitalea chrysea]GLB51862.1 hypothetical protein NBRC110019_09010 [Neptunitalea chrysea]